MNLYWERRGHGAPLVILHGLFGSGANWRTIAPRLAGREALLVDLRNHGASPHAPTMLLEEMAADLLAFLDELELESAGILGHSLGGKVAMRFACTAPERVRSLIVADIAPRAYGAAMESVAAAMQAVDLEVATTRKAAAADLASRLGNERLAAFLATNLRRLDGKLRWRIPLDVIRDSVSTVGGDPGAISPGFSGPTLFVRGGNSDYVADADLDLARTFFPDFRCVTLAGAGHWLHSDDPEGFAKAVTGFLEMSEGRGYPESAGLA